MRDRVLVTGLSAISSFGIGHVPLVDAVVSGASGIEPIAAFDTSACRSHCAAMIRGFDPAAFIPPLKLRRIDKVGRVTLACARRLLDDAARTVERSGSDDVGVALGTSTGGLDSTIEYLEGLTAAGPTGVPALLFSNTVSNAAASLCAIELGLRGPNVTFNQREASSLAAIAYAAGAVSDGRIDAMIAGGADRLEEIFFKAHDRFRAMSPMRGRSGPEAARPFDRCRNGFVFGEGGFLLMLESAPAADRRHARAYGEILGVGTASAATGLNEWPSEPSAIVRAMRLALEQAALAPDEVAAVYAAANGSPQLDAVESAALREVFGGRAVPVTSIKGAIGESGAAGAAALLVALAALGRGVLPPTAGFAERDPACPVAVAREARPIAGGVALVNSVAAAGTICSVLIRAMIA